MHSSAIVSSPDFTQVCCDQMELKDIVDSKSKLPRYGGVASAKCPARYRHSGSFAAHDDTVNSMCLRGRIVDESSFSAAHVQWQTLRVSIGCVAVGKSLGSKHSLWRKR